MTVISTNKARKMLTGFIKETLTPLNLEVGEIDEDIVAKQERIELFRNNYSKFVDYYFPHYTRNKADTTGKFQIDMADYLKTNSRARHVIQWARGHAKTTHFCLMIPMWLMMQKKRSINTMVIVGKNEDNARKILQDLRDELETNKRFISDFGVQYNPRVLGTGEFTTRDGVFFKAIGRGQSPRGLKKRQNRPDYIVCDDVDDDELCESEDRVNKLFEWVLSALMGTMQMGRGRFIIVGNKISKNSIVHKAEHNEGFTTTQVNALDENGNPSWHIYTKEEIDKEIKIRGYKASQKEFFNNPLVQGTVFDIKWFKYIYPLQLSSYDSLVAYCDPSFKEGRTSDYKAVVLVGKTGVNLHVLDCFVRKCSIKMMVQYFYELDRLMSLNNAICSYYIESNFIQDLFLEDFKKEGENIGYNIAIRGDYRKKPNKFQRIEAISPLFERGFIYFNQDKSNNKDFKRLKEQLLSFSKGSRAHDDAPDALEGAISILESRYKLMNFKSTFGKYNNLKSY